MTKNRPISREDLRSYSADGIIATREANVIAFDNQGDVTAVINKVWKVRPGQCKSINYSDTSVISETEYRVAFDLTDPFTTGTNKDLVVITSFIQLPDKQNRYNGPDNCK